MYRWPAPVRGESRLSPLHPDRLSQRRGMHHERADQMLAEAPVAQRLSLLTPLLAPQIVHSPVSCGASVTTPSPITLDLGYASRRAQSSDDGIGITRIGDKQHHGNRRFRPILMGDRCATENTDIH